MSTTPQSPRRSRKPARSRLSVNRFTVYRVADLEGEQQIALGLYLYRHGWSGSVPRSRHGYIGQKLGARGTQNDIEEESNSSCCRMLCGATMDTTKPGVPVSLCSADGLTFKPDNDLLVLVRDADVRLYCAQADVLWVDYPNFAKATQFPDVTAAKALGQLLEDAQKKVAKCPAVRARYWKVTRLARGLVRRQSQPHAVALLALASTAGSGGGK